MRNARIIAGLGSLLAVAGAAQAQTLHFNFIIEGSQEVPPVVTAGIGVGDVFLDTQTNALSWNIGYTQLTGPATGAHMHGPALVGQNAGVQISFGAPANIISPIIGNAIITQQQADDLKAGLWYVNIHTSRHPGGEIRGQIVPAPGALCLIAGAGLFVTRRRR